MDMLWYGLKVAAVGMLVVFAGLVILIGCIKALTALGKGKQQDATPAAAPPVQAQPVAPQPVAAAPQPAVQAAPRAYVPGPPITRRDDAFYAVVTAAVSQVLADEGINPDGGFAIRDIRTIREPAAGPALTTKDDALYAIITAAVARVLEAEGRNPESGFAIRSVKAL